MTDYRKAADAAKASTVPEDISVIRADQIKMEGIDWAWTGRFALGKLGLLGGNPERGKGLIIADMTSRFTRGAPWPCNEGTAPQGDVVILQQEDDESDTLAPRLKAAGADMTRVHILGMVKKIDGSSERMFNLANDLPRLEGVLDKIEEPVLLAIDPLTAYIGKLNASSNNEVRSVLMPLVELLKRFHMLGLAVMHFNKKVDIDSALARISDSLAFGAAARHCFVATDDAENERRLLVKAKNNLAPDVKALSYRIEAVFAGHDHRDGRIIKAPRIVWGIEHVEISTTEAMRAETSGTGARNPRMEAKDLLNKILGGKGMAQKEVEDIAEGEGISIITLRRAKKELGIVSSKNGLDGVWHWSLPGDAATQKGTPEEF